MKTDVSQFDSELENIAKRDQNARFPWNPEKAREIEIEGTALAREIIDHCKGWPPISQEGEDFSIRLWLLVQHASSTPDFQEDA